MATGPDSWRWRRLLSRLLKCGALFLVLLVLLCGTRPGLWLCAKAVSGIVSASSPFSLHVSGVSGILPFSLKIARIELLDGGGLWLTADNIVLHTDVQGFLRGDVKLSSLACEELRWDRTPIREPRWRIPKIAGLSYYPAADAVSVGKLSLGKKILGRPVSLTVQGRVERGGVGGERIVLTGKRNDGIAGMLDLTYAQGSDAPRCEAHIEDSEIVPAWLGLDGVVVLDVTGSGPREDWRGTLKATACSQTILDGALQFSGEFPTVITASLDTKIAPSHRLNAVERFLGPDGHLAFNALLAKSGRLDILDLDASSPLGTVQGAGTALIPERQIELAFQANHADLSLVSCREEGTGPYLPAEVFASVKGDASKLDVNLVASSRAAPLFCAESAILPGAAVQINGAARVYTCPFTDSDAVQRALGGDTALGWSAHYDPPGRLVIGSLVAENETVQMSASGSVEFPSTSAAVQYRGILHSDRVPFLAEHLEPGDGVPFAGEMVDSLSSPTLLLTARNLNGSFKGVSAKDAILSLGFQLGQAESGRTLRKGLLRIESTRCGYNEGPALAVACSAQFESDDFDKYRVQGIEVTMPTVGGHLGAEMDYVRSSGKTQLRGSLSVDELSATAGLYPNPLGGALSGAFRLDKAKAGESLQFSAEGDWQHPSGLPEILGRMAGDKVHASVRMQADDDRVHIEEASVRSDAGTVSGSGWQNRADRRFKLVANTKLKDLEKVSSTQSLQGIGGSLDMSTHWEGTPDNFSSTGDADLKGLSWDRLAVKSTKLKFKGEHLPGAPEGTLMLSMSNGKKGPSLDGSLSYRYQDRVLHVEKAKFKSSKNRVEGSLKYHADSGEFSSSADFALPGLKDLSQLLSVDLSGSVQGRVVASKKGDDLDVTLRGKAEKLATPWGSIGLLDANGSVVDILRKPLGNAKISAAEVGSGGLQLGKADISLSGDGASVSARTVLSGRYQKNETAAFIPFQLKAATSAMFPKQEFNVSEATGQLGGLDFSLTGPAHIRAVAGGYALDNTGFHFGGGGGEVALETSPRGIHAVSSWKDIPLSAAALAAGGSLEGSTSGSLAVEGPLQAPKCHLDMQLAKIKKMGSQKGPGLDASIKAVHEGGWTSAEISSTLLDAAKASVSARVPLNLSLSPRVFAVREQEALQADADVSCDLAAVAVLMNWLNDLPQGTVTGKFRLAGTVEAPKVSGELNLKDGGYENLVYGAVLKDLRVHLVADGSAVRIAEFSGTDGDSGRLSATGQMEVDFARSHPFRADVTLNRMRSLRTEYGTAVLSGQLQVSGSMAKATLKGSVTADEGDFKLPERMNASKSTKVEFTDKNAAATPPVITETGTAKMPAIALDMSVSIPGRITVRAPVLETEWNGETRFLGTLKEPRVEGELRVRRGYLDLLGQRFSLADSTVGFANGDTRTPYLNMTGVCMANGITARIQLSGPPSDAQLTLSSDPPLPQDEILSKLLFRKGVSQASPLQALQIARAASMFSDRLSLGQLLTGSLKLPGVDLFDIRTGEKVDKTVVGVGKYINDKIYVEAEQGATADSGRVSAQVEVTPGVSVKADVGARNRGGVGIMWKKDY